jgi:hypothetical protein
MTFVIKPQAPFERLKIANTCPEIALKKAIILQAIIDASDISNAKATRKITLTAKEWLFGNSKAFRDNCIDANLDPEFVVKIAAQMISQHHQTCEKKTQRFNKKDIQKIFITKKSLFA